jgi:hypothetical protein
MANYTATPSYDSITPDEGFKLAQKVLPEAGFTIWKERPLGWLLMANQQRAEGIINATLSFRPGRPTEMNFSVSGDNHAEQTLKQAADRFLALFEDKLHSSLGPDAP